jgi:hypothetical protein
MLALYSTISPSKLFGLTPEDFYDRAEVWTAVFRAKNVSESELDQAFSQIMGTSKTLVGTAEILEIVFENRLKNQPLIVDNDRKKFDEILGRVYQHHVLSASDAKFALDYASVCNIQLFHKIKASLEDSAQRTCK